MALGGSAHFDCKISGSPEIRVVWYKNDTELQPSEKLNLSFAENVALLDINDFSPEDSGDYTCEAHNDAGSASCSTSITVKGAKLLLLSFLYLYYFSQYNQITFY